MTSLSTLSTGLNKSDEFIKDHATHIHSRAFTFQNGQLLYLNEDSAVPAVADNDLTRDFRCQNITYFQDYDIYHSDIQVSITYTTSQPVTIATISKTSLNELGIVQGINDALSPLDANVHVTSDDSGDHDYSGMRFFIDNVVQKFQINYEGAWLLGAIPTFSYNQQRALFTLYDKGVIDNVQRNSSSQLSRVFYPLHNGGIHKLVVSEDTLATSQYINGNKTATIAEINIAPTLKSKRIRRRKWTSSNEVIRYILTVHPQEPTGSRIGEIHTSSPDDDPELKNALPSRISYLLCNERIFHNIIEAVVVNKPASSSTVVRSSTDVTNSAHVGEIQLDLTQLSLYSYKWHLKVHMNTPTDLSSRAVAVIWFNQKVMFTFRDALGNTLMYKKSPSSSGSGSSSSSTKSSPAAVPLSYVQSRIFPHEWSVNIDTLTKDAEYDITFDISHPNLMSAKYVCIRHYGHIHGDVTDKGALTATLQLLPLDENDTDKDFIKRKFPSKSNVITAQSTLRGDQPMSSVVNRTSTYPSTLFFLSPRSKTFNERESPWLECATANKISSLRLHVQDEYGQDIKTTSVAHAPFYLNIAFADVPINVNSK